MSSQNTDKEIIFLNKIFFWVCIACGVLCLALIVLFFQNQYFNRQQPIDGAAFGSFGDVVGGVVGTIVAFVSAYLLLRTFKNQAAVNESVITSNNVTKATSEAQFYQIQLQTFDSKFKSFLDTYQRAIAAYRHCDKEGRIAFEEIAQQFGSGFKNEKDYRHRMESAVEEYKDFYARHATEMSVHFRMLYLLIKLVSESELEVEDKVLYAKLVRGQMSDAEMILLRYNCLSEYGMKMRPYCNEFNLIKHEPVLSLLEFSKYKNKLIEKDNLLEEEIRGLNTLFVTLRKRISKMFNKENSCNYDQVVVGERYTIKFYKNNKRTNFTLEFEGNLKAQRKGKGRITAAESALDILKDYDKGTSVRDLFKDFLTELLFVSNYYCFNSSDAKIELKNQLSVNQNAISFSLTIDDSEGIAITNIQRLQRNSVVEEEIS